MSRTVRLQAKILAALDMTKELEDEALTELIYQVLEEESKVDFLSLKERKKLGRELFNAFRKLDILEEFLEDESVTEIMINGTNPIYFERKGRIYASQKRFASKERLEDLIQQIVADSNRMINDSRPIADARLKDGSRVNVILHPVALNGPIVTIRKFPKKGIGMKDLLHWKSLSPEIDECLKKLVISGYNILISGGTGSGKTTFLNALSQYIPKDQRVITIEDNAELQIRGIPNLVRLEARNENVEGKGQITIRDLIRSALRMRPDRILVGEIRSEEAIDMLQAFNTGHSGSLSTGHANSTRDMLSRIETMVLMGMELPISAIQRQIASGVDIIIHLGRLRDKSRKLLEITEVTGYEQGEIGMRTLFRFVETGEEGGKVEGVWEKVDELLHQEKLLAAGY